MFVLFNKSLILFRFKLLVWSKCWYFFGIKFFFSYNIDFILVKNGMGFSKEWV